MVLVLAGRVVVLALFIMETQHHVHLPVADQIKLVHLQALQVVELKVAEVVGVHQEVRQLKEQQPYFL
jgi:hypothetical protein